MNPDPDICEKARRSLHVGVPMNGGAREGKEEVGWNVGDREDQIAWIQYADQRVRTGTGQRKHHRCREESTKLRGQIVCIMQHHVMCMSPRRSRSHRCREPPHRPTTQ